MFGQTLKQIAVYSLLLFTLLCAACADKEEAAHEAKSASQQSDVIVEKAETSRSEPEQFDLERTVTADRMELRVSDADEDSVDDALMDIQETAAEAGDALEATAEEIAEEVEAREESLVAAVDTKLQASDRGDINRDVSRTAQAQSQYTVKAGDTLGRIAISLGVSVDSLAKSNNLSDVNAIRVGQQLNY